MTYQYKSKDPIVEKIKYEYSEYIGEVFITEWENYRNKFLTSNNLVKKKLQRPTKNKFNISDKKISTKDFINFLSDQSNSQNKATEEILDLINWLIKRFELSKRIYENYKKTERGGKGIGNFRDLSLYLDFAELLVKANQVYNHLPSLNALIKCLDTILCYQKSLNKEENERLSNIILKERDLFYKLKNNYFKLINQKINQNKNIKQKNNSTKKDLKKVLFLASDTSRSRGYAQTLLKNGFTIENSILLKSESNEIKLGKSPSPKKPSRNNISGISIPDLRIPLEESLKSLSKNIHTIKSGTINSEIVEEYVKKLNPFLIIYSGFGGEIVSKELIEKGIPFLHMHSGTLPYFRGSTTIYYSLLKTAKCGVSAIFLSSEIDEGDIVSRKSYAKPDCECNLDYEYDTALRSDLLIEVLNDYCKNNFKIITKKQKKEHGQTYYVIHPLLKHLTLIGLN